MLSLCGAELRKTRKRLRLELEKTGGEGPGTKAAQYLHKTAEVRTMTHGSIRQYLPTLVQYDRPWLSTSCRSRGVCAREGTDQAVHA